MLQLNRKNIQSFCRTCLGCLVPMGEDITASSVNFNIRETPNLKKILILCTTFNIDDDIDAAYPQQVCIKCYITLQEIQRFRDMALQSNEVLRRIVENVDGVVATNEKHCEDLPLAKAEVEHSSDQNLPNEHFEASQPEVSDSYFAVQEKGMEFDEFVDNSREIKIETAMFDIDTYVNPAESATANEMDCSAKAVDIASTSKAAAKRKHNTDDDEPEIFQCPIVDCTKEFTSKRSLQSHNNTVHMADGNVLFGHEDSMLDDKVTFPRLYNKASSTLAEKVPIDNSKRICTHNNTYLPEDFIFLSNSDDPVPKEVMREAEEARARHVLGKRVRFKRRVEDKLYTFVISRHGKTTIRPANMRKMDDRLGNEDSMYKDKAAAPTIAGKRLDTPCKLPRLTSKPSENTIPTLAEKVLDGNSENPHMMGDPLDNEDSVFKDKATASIIAAKKLATLCETPRLTSKPSGSTTSAHAEKVLGEKSENPHRMGDLLDNEDSMLKDKAHVPTIVAKKLATLCETPRIPSKPSGSTTSILVEKVLDRKSENPHIMGDPLDSEDSVFKDKATAPIIAAKKLATLCEAPRLTSKPSDSTTSTLSEKVLDEKSENPHTQDIDVSCIDCYDPEWPNELFHKIAQVKARHTLGKRFRFKNTIEGKTFQISICRKGNVNIRPRK